MMINVIAVFTGLAAAIIHASFGDINWVFIDLLTAFINLLFAIRWIRNVF